VFHAPKERANLQRRWKDALPLASVARAAESLGTPPGGWVTRFAPSPTGELHLGHVRHLVWLDAVSTMLGARVIVRIEDHDRQRCTPANEASILADLDWLGTAVDVESRRSLDAHPSPFRQSDTPERHAAAFESLAERGLLYGCTCTRSQLGAPGPDGERYYPGTCRGQPIDRPGAQVRVMLPDEPTALPDLLLGTLAQHPAREHGDPVIRDAHGQWMYLLGVVVDDIAHGVNLVVRGDDLRTSTGRQWLLARLLGRTAPVVTLHHPLLLDAVGRKLSKRDGDTTIRSLRERGMSVEEVVGRATSGE
jgi:glutamyl-Q tRNA(Asp) synthetase